jgi:hypothetical protein
MPVCPCFPSETRATDQPFVEAPAWSPVTLAGDLPNRCPASPKFHTKQRLQVSSHSEVSPPCCSARSMHFLRSPATMRNATPQTPRQQKAEGQKGLVWEVCRWLRCEKCYLSTPYMYIGTRKHHIFYSVHCSLFTQFIPSSTRSDNTLSYLAPLSHPSHPRK